MQVKKDTLIDAVKAAGLFIAPKSKDLDIVTKILIDTENSRVIGTNLINYSVTTVKFDGHNNEKFLVDKDFHKILKACPADGAGMIDLTVKTWEDTEGLLVESKMAVCVGKFKEISVTTGEDFPKLPTISDDTALIFYGEKYSPAILGEISKIGSAKNEMREYVTHVLIAGDKHEAASTDGNMLGKAKISEMPVGLENVLLPKNALIGAAKIFSNDMKLMVDVEKYAVLKDRYEKKDADGSTQVIMQLPDGVIYPDYDALFKKNLSDHTVHVSSKAVLDVLKNVLLVAEKDCPGVHVTANGGLSFKVKNPLRGVFHEEAIPFKEGDMELDEPRHQVFNANFLIAAIKGSKADVAITFAENPEAPLHVVSDTGVINYAIMAMRE